MQVNKSHLEVIEMIFSAKKGQSSDYRQLHAGVPCCHYRLSRLLEMRAMYLRARAVLIPSKAQQNRFLLITHSI